MNFNRILKIYKVPCFLIRKITNNKNIEVVFKFNNKDKCFKKNCKKCKSISNNNLKNI